MREQAYRLTLTLAVSIGDGDIDLVLGSFAAAGSNVVPSPYALAARWARAPPFVVLRNKLSDR